MNGPLSVARVGESRAFQRWVARDLVVTPG